MARFTLSPHALHRLAHKRKDIKYEWIERAVLAPEVVIDQIDRRHCHYRRIPERGGRWLKVVLSPSKQTVITFYFDGTFEP